MQKASDRWPTLAAIWKKPNTIMDFGAPVAV
jgi:hypothetical protein